MNKFIEVIDRNRKRHLINIRHIEEIVEVDEKRCFIYLDIAYSETQDYYDIQESYETIKLLIMQKGGEG